MHKKRHEICFPCENLYHVSSLVNIFQHLEVLSSFSIFSAFPSLYSILLFLSQSNYYTPSLWHYLGFLQQMHTNNETVVLPYSIGLNVQCNKYCVARLSGKHIFSRDKYVQRDTRSASHDHCTHNKNNNNIFTSFMLCLSETCIKSLNFISFLTSILILSFTYTYKMHFIHIFVGSRRRK